MVKRALLFAILTATIESIFACTLTIGGGAIEIYDHVKEQHPKSAFLISGRSPAFLHAVLDARGEATVWMPGTSVGSLARIADDGWMLRRMGIDAYNWRDNWFAHVANTVDKLRQTPGDEIAVVDTCVSGISLVFVASAIQERARAVGETRPIVAIALAADPKDGTFARNIEQLEAKGIKTHIIDLSQPRYRALHRRSFFVDGDLEIADSQFDPFAFSPEKMFPGKVSIDDIPQTPSERFRRLQRQILRSEK